ncbi:Vacuolar iron transporter (VIT) family protein [Euphorbia peplus]|nr:Vacuolar iron transporter (VIT) family protein [Euphorbia peplus]
MTISNPSPACNSCSDHHHSNTNTNTNTAKAADKESDTKTRLQRAQWLRAAILGACDGLLSTTSLMLGIGAAQEDKRSMVLSGLAGAVAGACSMAVGEFVSVSTQRDIEKAASSSLAPDEHHQKLEIVTVEAISIDQQTTTLEKIILKSPLPGTGGFKIVEEEEGSEMVFTNPYQAAAASALAFLCGSSVPLLSAMFVTTKTLTRILVTLVVTTIASAVFGGAGAYLGGSSAVRTSAIRVVIGGWISMAITYALLKPFDNDD